MSIILSNYDCAFKKRSIYYVKGRILEREGKADIFHLLIHLQNGLNGQDLTRPKLGSRSFILVSLVGAGTHKLWPYSAVSQYLNKKLDQKWSHLDLNQGHYGVLASQALT